MNTFLYSIKRFIKYLILFYSFFIKNFRKKYLFAFVDKNYSYLYANLKSI